MKVALIIATYNWPSALECCLNSLLLQSKMPDEIIIADDGSTEDTKLLIQQFSTLHKIPLSHVWHEDTGFKLAHIRNKAIAKAQSDYIIQIDGDIIMHTDFVKDHYDNAEECRYLKGSRVLMNEESSAHFLYHKKEQPSFLSSGIVNRLNAVHISIFQKLFFKKITNPFKIRGCNMSFWRKNFIDVNGYNEDIAGWGREDSELVMRFINGNIFGKTLKFGGIAFHLYHKENSKSDLNANHKILEETISNKTTRCTNGINKYL
jgi:glycosyltransferase involved in cell wall biosynthesis